MTAKIIADSISDAGIRITTLELEYPRFIHSQFMTHRQFSRNAQSSRAIPTVKQIELIKNTPAPHFLKNKAGMQAGEEFKDWEHYYAVNYWNQARDYAIEQAKQMLDLGVHKQWVNRLLESFSTIKVVVTATEWQNFFNLRLHHDAQPEIQELAQAMKVAMDESRPLESAWHLPYMPKTMETVNLGMEKAALISAARCARVSYLNHDNTNPDIEKDLELARQLLADGHLSPFEHQAKPMQHLNNMWQGSLLSENGTTHKDKKGNVWSGNFRGWISHRNLI